MEQKGQVMTDRRTSGVILFLVGMLMLVAGIAVEESGNVTIFQLAGVHYGLPGWYIGGALSMLAEVPIVVGLWKYFKRR